MSGIRRTVGCFISPNMYPTLFGLLIFGTQRGKKERRERRCAPVASCGDARTQRLAEQSGWEYEGRAQSKKNAGRTTHQTEQPTEYGGPAGHI